MNNRHRNTPPPLRSRIRLTVTAPFFALFSRPGRVLAAAFAVLAVFVAAGTYLAASRPDHRAALLKAYPDQLRSIKGNSVAWFDGSTMPYDDGRAAKTFAELLDQPDLEDQMSMPYPGGRAADAPPPRNFDPGRIRYDPFFRKMYGATHKEVEEHLATVRWLPRTVDLPVRVTRINGVADRVRKISDELESLPPSIQRYVRKIAGSYFWRPIAGTDRLSMHSFGIAIDIDTRYADYWRWDGPGRDGSYVYRNRIPREIVSVFEKHGFIWGGAWYHYDTMHFEYRPELLTGSAGR